MTNTQPARTVDLDALAAQLAGQLEDPTYCLDVGVTGNTGDGFVRFDTTQTVVRTVLGREETTVRATVSLVSDGEDEVPGAAGEVVEIVVSRVVA